MNENIKKILIAIVIIVALFFVYRLFFSGSGPVAALKIEKSQSSASVKAGKDFLVALINLQHIDLDAGAAILKDDNFIKLRDMSVSLPNEPQGRPDPFKPIGSDTGSVSSSTSVTSSAGTN